MTSSSEEPVDPVPLLSLSVALSWRCNFECAHCGQPPAGERPVDELTTAELEAWLPPLQDRLTWICFTGGEPTLDPERLVAGIATCTRARIPSTLLTHGKWISVPAQGERLMARLWEAGLRAFGISYDEYHDPFCSRDRVKECVSRASQFGFDVTVKLVQTPNYVASMREEFLSAGASSVTTQPLDPVGRGKLLPVLPHSASGLNSCFELLSPMLTPNGDVYACCSSRALGPASSHYLGNARQIPLLEILDARQRNALLLAETVLGPGGLARLLGEEPFGQLCGLCHDLMSDPEKVKRISERVAQPEVRRRVQGMHLLARAQEDPKDLLLPVVYEPLGESRGA